MTKSLTTLNQCPVIYKKGSYKIIVLRFSIGRSFTYSNPDVIVSKTKLK